jgi:SAM-dependent methyltransferase
VVSDKSFVRPRYEDSNRPVLLNMVPPNIRRVLDVGCNQGGFGAALKARGDVEVWGVEPDRDSAAIAATRLDRVIVDFFRDTADLPNQHFDLITFNDSLEHMTDPLEALSVARRKLMPGGIIQCCVPNMRHIESLEHLLIDKNWAYEENGVRDRTHLRFFTQRSAIELFESAGFEVLESKFVGENWWDSSKKMRRFLFRLFPKIAADMKYKQIVILARSTE